MILDRQLGLKDIVCVPFLGEGKSVGGRLVLGLQGAYGLLDIVIVLASEIEVDLVLGLGFDVELDGSVVCKY